MGCQCWFSWLGTGINIPFVQAINTTCCCYSVKPMVPIQKSLQSHPIAIKEIFSHPIVIDALDIDPLTFTQRIKNTAQAISNNPQVRNSVTNGLSSLKNYPQAQRLFYSLLQKAIDGLQQKAGLGARVSAQVEPSVIKTVHAPNNPLQRFGTME